LKGSNVFGRHANNETTNHFGWGNTAKAQKVGAPREQQPAPVVRLSSVRYCSNLNQCRSRRSSAGAFRIWWYRKFRRRESRTSLSLLARRWSW
jgi:hypothetical protein